jgi:hypothetical protein
VSDSILESTKKVLNLASDYDVFDQDVIMHINSAFSTLNQLGVGPDQGFMIEDDVPTWEAFIGTDPRLNHIKSYVFLRVRLLFDPPTTGYMVEATQKQILELEWRINSQREDVAWTDPNTGEVVDNTSILDGGVV